MSQLNTNTTIRFRTSDLAQFAKSARAIGASDTDWLTIGGRLGEIACRRPDGMLVMYSATAHRGNGVTISLLDADKIADAATRLSSAHIDMAETTLGVAVASGEKGPTLHVYTMPVQSYSLVVERHVLAKVCGKAGFAYTTKDAVLDAISRCADRRATIAIGPSGVTVGAVEISCPTTGPACSAAINVAAVWKMLSSISSVGSADVSIYIDPESRTAYIKEIDSKIECIIKEEQ